MNLMESAYNSVLRFSFAALNPLKKMVINTHCEVHKFINDQALEILKNDHRFNEYTFFKHFISDINDGAVWADQDFKSSNHFYNPHTEKGLYGRSNAMDLALEYYNKCITLTRIGDMNRAMVYFGASAHLIQDMTIPQHANVRLLDNHKQYETFVKKTYEYAQKYKAQSGAYQLSSLENYIKFNARIAMKVYKRYKNIQEDEVRFQKIANCTLPLAERTTAGCMLTYYNKVFH